MLCDFETQRSSKFSWFENVGMVGLQTLGPVLPGAHQNLAKLVSEQGWIMDIRQSAFLGVVIELQ